MVRTKMAAKKSAPEERILALPNRRPKKWDKSDVNHYNRMKSVSVPPTQIACTDTMRTLGIQADVEGLFVNMGLGQLYRLHEKTYPDLTRQFVASAYVTYADDEHEEGFLAFMVEKVYFEITFADLCDLFGLSNGTRTSLLWSDRMLDFWQFIGTGIYGSPQSKESLIRSPVLRYAVRLVGSLLYGTATPSSVTQWELSLLYQGVRHLLPELAIDDLPPITEFNLGAVLAANLAAYKGKVTQTKGRVCGFGAVITRILRHFEFDLDSHEPAMTKFGKIDWNDLDLASLVSKEFLAGPYSTIRGTGPYVYIFQDRERKRLYCELPRVDQTALLSADAVEFLPPPTALVPKPSFFRPKYQDRGASSSSAHPQQHAEGSSAAHEEAAPEDDPQPYHLLPTDSSEYMLSELPPNATKRQHQQWTQESIKKNNTMLHKIWAAISRIRPCACRTDDTVPRHATPTSSGDSGARRPSKRSRQDDAGPSGAADDE